MNLGGLGRASVDPFEATAAPSESEPAYKPPKKDDPSGCLLIGRKHGHRADEYRVCLTENQEQTLLKGNKIGKKLGCGVFACAYALGRAKVVKFTRDRDDVAALLEAQGSGVVPKVYNVFKLKQGGHMAPHDEEVPVYAMTLERLKTLSSVPARKALDEALFSDPPCRGHGPEVAKICFRTLDVQRKLGALGIDWGDVHSGNIGVDRAGHVKALDLGLTNTQLKQRIDVLAGRRPGRPIKQHVRSM